MARGSTHKGDSPAKKMARAAFWTHVRRGLTKTRWQAGPHLVLASHSTGDIPVLLGLGAKPSSIVAVDTDPEAVMAALEAYPGIRAVNDNVFNVAEEYRFKLASCFLDFCGSMNLEAIDGLVEILKTMPDRSFWGIAFSYGREGKRFEEDVRYMKSFLQELEVKNSRLRELGVLHEGDFLDTEKERSRMPPGLERSYLLDEYVFWSLANDTWGKPPPVLPSISSTRIRVSYKSSTEFSPGMPMFLIGALLLRRQRNETPALFKGRLEALGSYRLGETIQIPGDINERLMVLDFYDWGLRHGLRRDQICQVMNISEELLATWVPR